MWTRGVLSGFDGGRCGIFFFSIGPKYRDTIGSKSDKMMPDQANGRRKTAAGTRVLYYRHTGVGGYDCPRGDVSRTSVRSCLNNETGRLVPYMDNCETINDSRNAT